MLRENCRDIFWHCVFIISSAREGGDLLRTVIDDYVKSFYFELSNGSQEFYKIKFVNHVGHGHRYRTGAAFFVHPRI